MSKKRKLAKKILSKKNGCLDIKKLNCDKCKFEKQCYKNSTSGEKSHEVVTEWLKKHPKKDKTPEEEVNLTPIEEALLSLNACHSFLVDIEFIDNIEIPLKKDVRDTIDKLERDLYE